jgi:hypothetical protein
MADDETRRIDKWMPCFDVGSRHERAVSAPPARTYAAVRRVDLAADPLVRALFSVRGLVRPRRPRRTFTLEGFVAAGFTLLEEVPGREIILGLTGRFWRPSGDLMRLESDAFAAFDEPGWAQAVWSFEIALVGAGSVVATETRVRATDQVARRAFRRYWRVVGPFSGVVRRRTLALIAADAQQTPA